MEDNMELTAPGRKSRKQSLYSKVLAEADLPDFEHAAAVDGIEDEIAILRLKLKDLLANKRQNLRLIMKVADMLAKLVKIQHKIDKDRKKGLKEAVGNIIRDIAIPLGVSIVQKEIKK